MYSIFKVKYNWGYYFLALIAIRILWIDITWYSFFAFALTLNQFILLFNSIGAVIPIRYLAGLLMCIQMLLGPAFAYNGLDTYQYETYKMKIPEWQYFQYVLPATLAFIFGLHFTARKLKGEVLNQAAIMRFVDRSGNLPYIFIGVGFVATLISSFFGSAFNFIFVLLSNFKFIGLFMLLLGSRKIKILPIAVVMGSVIIEALRIAMFHDLLIWIIMTGALLGIKFKVKFPLKLAVTFGFVILAITIQLLKKDYRENVGTKGEGLGTLESVYIEQSTDKPFFSFEKLAESNVRINQGYIITNIMQNVPEKIPFENGKELALILEAAFMPRILAPNKLNAGDRTIFMKYTGMLLQQGTSMGLSSVGDAYVNFGVVGGIIMMFFFGWLFSAVLNGFHTNSKYYPVLLLFTPLIFYYPIRPDCELQTSLGHLVKSIVLIWVIVRVWNKSFFSRPFFFKPVVQS